MSDGKDVDLWRDLIETGEQTEPAAFKEEKPKPDAPKDKLPTDCGVCTYHHKQTKECRRHAPHPGHDEAYMVALWNFSKDRDRCGAGAR